MPILYEKSRRLGLTWNEGVVLVSGVFLGGGFVGFFFF